MPGFAFSAASALPIEAPAEAVFGYLDDPRNLSAHMEQPSWAMMGSRMEVHMDARGTRSVGSKFGFAGSFLGIPLSVEEIVTERDPPRAKAWATVGEPTLWVVGRYRMGFTIVPRSASSLLTVFIDYDLPEGPGTRALGWLLGEFYAGWCTRRMAAGAARHFFQGGQRGPGDGAERCQLRLLRRIRLPTDSRRSIHGTPGIRGRRRDNDRCGLQFYKRGS